MNLNQNQYQNNAFLSVQRKRQALWNVLQPGDPYDIRKSMIAKVPFDKKTFMGDHLELVCLFQAAQIQRLSQFLDDFKIRYREIQRIKLDRHSYEVQIQQLTHRLAEQAVFRQENQKLKQFLKNQNLSKQGVQDSIKTKYEKLLIQAKNFQEENNALRQRNNQLGSQISSFDAKFEALKKSVNSEYDQKMKQSQNTSMSTQLEINSLKSQYESEVQRLDLENKRIRQLNDEKNRQIESWQSKYKILEQQLLRNSPKSQSKIAEYQNRFIIFGQEIDRLNLVIKQISNKFQISQQRNHEYELQYDALSKEMMLLQSSNQQIQDLNKKLSRTIAELESENRRIHESGKLVKDYQLKLRQANEEILRLGGQIKVEIQNANILREQVQRYQYEESRIKILEKELYEYKQSHENNNLKLKLAQDQNQVAILKQQIERLREQLSKRNGLEVNQKNLAIENKNLAIKINEWERKYQMTVQEYEMKINQKVSEYEARLQNTNRTKGFEYESKASLLQNQLQRVSDLLKRKQEEIDAYQKQIRQLQYSITNKYQIDTSRKVQNYESIIQGLKRENQELVRRIRELEPLQRKINEYENKSTITSQQIQRLTQHIRSRQNEIENMRRQIRQQEIAIVQKYEMDTSRKLGNYENILNDLNRQNQDLKRKYTEIQNKAALLSQQIERLTNNLRQFQLRNSQYEQQIQNLQRYSKETELNINRKYEVEINQKVTNYETAIRNQQRQIEELRRRIVELENSNRKLVEYENQLKMAGQQIQRLNNLIRQKQQETLHLDTNHRNLIREFEDLGRKYNELQAAVRNKFEVETTKTINTLEQNVGNLKRQNDELKRVIQEFELRNKKQGADFQTLSRNLRNSTQQNENLKRQIIELENSFRNKIQVQVNGKYRSYESNISEIKRQFENVVRQNNQLKRVIQNAQQTNSRLNQENQELRRRFQHDFGQANKRITDSDSKIHQLQNQNQNLKRKILELQTIIRQKYEIQTTRRISNLDQNLANAARQNQELRRRLQLATRQLDDIRRVTQKIEQDNQQLVQRLRQFGQINKKVVEYENKISLLNQQLRVKNDNMAKAEAFIKQLTQKLQNAQRNMAQSQSSIQQFEVDVKGKILQYEQNLQLLNQENTELKRRLNILDDMNRKIAEYENKIMILNQELERININLKNQVEKSNQLENALRNSNTQNENLRRNIIEIQNTVTQKYQVQATRAIRTLEQNFDGAQKQNAQLKKVLQEFQQSLQARNADLQKLTINIKNLSDENLMLKNQLKQTQVSMVRKYQTQVNSRQSIYEQNLSGLGRQNEQLKRRLGEFQQQIEKFVRKINQLQHQNQNIRRQGKQTEIQVIQKFQVETTQQINNYKQQITQIQTQFRNAQKQNQQLHRRLNDFGGQVNRKIAHDEQELKRAALEIERLTGRIRQYEMKLRELSSENEGLKRQVKETQIGLSQRWESELRSKVANFEQIASNHQRERQELQNTIKNLSRSFQEKEMNLNNQASKRIAELQSKVALLSQQLEHVSQNLRLRSEEMERMRQEIQRLNNALRIKVEESRQYQTQITKFKSSTQSQFTQLQSNFTIVAKQNQNYKKHLIEYENSIKKLYGEFERLQNIINDLKRQRQSLFEKNYALSTQIDRLLNENKDLEVQVEDVRLRLTDESALSRRVNEHLALMVVLFAEIESLRKRVKDKERQVEDVRRSSLAPFKLDKSRPKMQSI